MKKYRIIHIEDNGSYECQIYSPVTATLSSSDGWKTMDEGRFLTLGDAELFINNIESKQEVVKVIKEYEF